MHGRATRAVLILLARDSSLDRNADPRHRLEVVVAGWVAERLLGGPDRKEDATDDLKRAASLAAEIAGAGPLAR